jgi:hypothetical protein
MVIQTRPRGNENPSLTEKSEFHEHMQQNELSLPNLNEDDEKDEVQEAYRGTLALHLITSTDE